MSKVKEVWAIASSSTEIAELVSAAKTLGESVVLVYRGERDSAVGADKAYYLGGNAKSFAEYAPTAAALVKAAIPALVLTRSSRDGRLAAGLVAAALGVSVITDLMELTVEDGEILGKRMVYGGAAIKTEKAISAGAVCCVGSGLFAVEQLASTADIEDVAVAESGIRLTDKRTKEKASVNLPAAKRVVGVGRGAGNAASLELLAQFTELVGGEMGCTRPIAEEEDLMPRETYIGVSGAMLKPEIYFGFGTSGQVQHMVGVSQSGTIFAVNKDKSAPIFSQCDYGLIGEIDKVVPQLIEKLK